MTNELQELEDAKRKAAKQVRELGLRRAIGLIATNKLHHGGDDYDGLTIFEGMQVGMKSKTIKNTYSTTKTYRHYVKRDKDMITLFEQVDDNLITFRDGPWAVRIVAEGRRIEQRLEKQARQRRSQDAVDQLGNFEEVDW